LRASGLAWDLRRPPNPTDAYSVYPELEFEVPIGLGLAGTVGDCWDRYWVRVQEMRQSLHMVEQCVEALLGPHARTFDFDPRAACPNRARPKHDELYFRAEGARGVLGFYFVAEPKRDIPFRVKCRGASFSNLSVLPELCRGVLLSDVVAILGSLDIVLCEIDR
jgi:NADH-quinone oxidoreductase subunit D